jgi:hypothetical protein
LVENRLDPCCTPIIQCKIIDIPHAAYSFI